MKVAELFEDREAPFTLTKADFERLPEPNASNIDTRFRVQNVAFDNIRGLGAVPNNQEVVYFGFVAEIKPSAFLNLALPADRREDGERFVEFIRQRAPIGSPFFDIEVNEEEWKEGKPLRVEVKGHEGRGRMWAVDTVNGNTPTPVHFFLRGGMRARDLNEKFFEDLRAEGIVRERGGKVAAPLKINFGRIFWQGKTL